MTGIYKYENLQNGKVYVGQSVDILRRHKDHLNRALNNFASNNEYNTPLHKAIRKYGIKNFSFTILEECRKEELNEKERYWIQHFNSYGTGYNLTSGGQNQENTMKFDEDFVQIIKDILINTSLTYEEIHKKYNISLGRISEINTGKIYYDSKLIYPLRSRKKKYYCSNCGSEIFSNKNLCEKCIKPKQRIAEKIITREELKALIRSEPFTKIGERFKITDNAIRKWCDTYKLPRTKKEINSYSNEEWEKI